MNAIVVVSSNMGIGREGGLLFSLKEDMRFFRRTTLGKTLVMGRRTLDSFPGGKPLPKRRNIVLTRDPDFEREGVEVVHSVPELLELTADVPEDEVFVAGGGQVYRQLLPYCKRVYMTRVEAEAPAEVFFPDVPHDPDFTLLKRSAPITENGLRYHFYIYERISPPWKNA